jgi:hypothetical protein
MLSIVTCCDELVPSDSKSSEGNLVWVRIPPPAPGFVLDRRERSKPVTAQPKAKPDSPFTHTEVENSALASHSSLSTVGRDRSLSRRSQRRSRTPRSRRQRSRTTPGQAPSFQPRLGTASQPPTSPEHTSWPGRTIPCSGRKPDAAGSE